MPRHINDEGLAKIKQWEGLRLKAYLDAADPPVWTIGYGHTSKAGPPVVKKGMTITKKEAETILRSDLSKFEAAVERLVKVPLNDSQFAALVSFTYNVGEGNLANSTLLKKLNKGDYGAVPDELMKWTRAGNARPQGLVNRRSAEVATWIKGDFVSSQYVEPSPVKGSIPIAQKAGAAMTAVGTAASTAAEQLMPVSEYSNVIKGLLVVFILVGVGVGLYSALTKAKEEST